MKEKKILKQYYSTKTNGFTYIEVIVATSIISLFSLVLWNGLSAAIKTASKTYSHGAIINEFNHLEFSFREAVNKAPNNYWSIEVNDEELEKSIRNSFHYKYLILNSIKSSDTNMIMNISTPTQEEILINAKRGNYIFGDDS